MPKWLKITTATFCSMLVVALAVFSGIKIYDYNLYNKTLEMPVLAIYTENQQDIVSKEEYIDCEVSVSNANDKVSFENKVGKIRGRGNSTWTESDKKPYRLKFDEKIDLFGDRVASVYELCASRVCN